MFYFLLALFGVFTLLSHSAEAQSEKERFEIARTEIKNLKEGFLLVRLQTRYNSLETIRERGMEEKADQMAAELKAENDQIIQAFQDEYDFSPVYFFNSEDSKHILQGNYDEVTFFDYDRDSVKLDLSSDNFLTAEFGNVQPDTARYKGSDVLRKGEDGLNREPTYGGSTDFGFGALIIMSNQFIQLPDPFPSSVRTFDTIFFLRRDPRKVVKRMNEKLFDFY